MPGRRRGRYSNPRRMSLIRSSAGHFQPLSHPSKCPAPPLLLQEIKSIVWPCQGSHKNAYRIFGGLHDVPVRDQGQATSCSCSSASLASARSGERPGTGQHALSTAVTRNSSRPMGPMREQLRSTSGIPAATGPAEEQGQRARPRQRAMRSMDMDMAKGWLPASPRLPEPGFLSAR